MKYYDELINGQSLQEQSIKLDSRTNRIVIPPFNLDKSVNDGVNNSSIIASRVKNTEEEELIEYALIINEIFNDDTDTSGNESSFVEFNRKADSINEYIKTRKKSNTNT